ncbi:50S ribosomal protein L25 [Candidatus Peregrinibacteria bacterium]|jgi:large subunit ribosomal protein L25|nr:50S ribosomal protein L25 [Candidatus Peregrinibacteria bacterium]MBT7337487.1 50S ribosomal protein L25 [Candidatus Peregrinibacteria bacterium]
MEMISLKAKARLADTPAKVLRRESIVPGVVYGNEAENTSIQCDYSEIYKAYVQAGGSTIVDLDIDGKKVPSLFHDLSFDPVSDRIIHVDFYAVNMKKEIEAQIPLEFIDESEAVKTLNGVLITTNDHVTVHCLPANLPHALHISLSSLKEFGDALHASDILPMDGVQIMDEPDTMIATVQEPRAAVEEVQEEAAATEDEEGEKKEGEEGDKKEGEEAKSE